jgi:hypothetical protein
MKATPIFGEICFIGSMKLSIPPNSSHETLSRLHCNAGAHENQAIADKLACAVMPKCALIAFTQSLSAMPGRSPLVLLMQSRFSLRQDGIAFR